MSAPEDLLYSVDHLWVRVEEDRATVGMAEAALRDMGEILLVDLPEVGVQIKEGERCAVVESAKAITDIMAPLSGKVVAVNQPLEKRSQTINKDPFGEGWLVVFHIDPAALPGRLMDIRQYQEHLEKEGAR
ncbi:MAG: glycine cleavage system protein GcvH [bacterium]